jgi:hypothetical protein
MSCLYLVNGLGGSNGAIGRLICVSYQYVMRLMKSICHEVDEINISWGWWNQYVMRLMKSICHEIDDINMSWGWWNQYVMRLMKSICHEVDEINMSWGWYNQYVMRSMIRGAKLKWLNIGSMFWKSDKIFQYYFLLSCFYVTFCNKVYINDSFRSSWLPKIW